MCSPSARAISCPERARLEEEYQAARDRMRGLRRLRKLTGIDDAAHQHDGGANHQERRLADELAMTIARLKEHTAAHGCERR